MYRQIGVKHGERYDAVRQIFVVLIEGFYRQGNFLTGRKNAPALTPTHVYGFVRIHYSIVSVTGQIIAVYGLNCSGRPGTLEDPRHYSSANRIVLLYCLDHKLIVFVDLHLRCLAKILQGNAVHIYDLRYARSHSWYTVRLIFRKMIQQLGEILIEIRRGKVGKRCRCLLFPDILFQSFEIWETVNSRLAHKGKLLVKMSVPGRLHIVVYMCAALIVGGVIEYSVGDEIFHRSLRHEHTCGIFHSIGIKLVSGADNYQRGVVSRSVKIVGNLVFQDILREGVGVLLVGDELILPDHKPQFVTQIVKNVAFGHTAAVPDADKLYSSVFCESQTPLVSFGVDII